jgi:hypothetical protein
MDESAWMKNIKWMTNLDEKINPSKNDKSPSRYQ